MAAAEATDAQPERPRAHQLHAPQGGRHPRPEVRRSEDQGGGEGDREEPRHEGSGVEGAGPGRRPRRGALQERAQGGRADGLFVRRKGDAEASG